jgi:hypothetical protein
MIRSRPATLFGNHRRFAPKDFSMSDQTSDLPQIGGIDIDQNADGYLCLNHLWRLGGGDDNRRPNKWWRGQAAKTLVAALSEKIGRISPNLAPVKNETLYYSTGRGRSAKTYAHPVLALAYAEFVLPILGVAVREIYLRYKGADLSLALEIIDELTAQGEYDLLRVELRRLVKEHNKLSAGTAAAAGVTNFEAYNGAGLRGLYGGMTKAQVLAKKGLPASASHLDHAGHEELAANYFKATQAIAKLKRDKIKGQAEANYAHEEVGEIVRGTIHQLGGTMPEDEPALDHIRHAEKRLKSSPLPLIE